MLERNGIRARGREEWWRVAHLLHLRVFEEKLHGTDTLLDLRHLLCLIVKSYDVSEDTREKTALSTRVLRIQLQKRKILRNLPLHCVKRGKGVRFSLVKNGSILNPKRGERRGERKKTKAIPQFSWKRRRMSIEQHTCAFLPLLLSVTHWMRIPTCKRKKPPCKCVASFPK